MPFAGSFGAAAALIPFGVIVNEKGEVGASYDADGRLAFTRASGQVYTPERFDTLIILGTTDGTPPLGLVTAGVPAIADADTGALVTAAAAANQHGLPTNFGPGRGNWESPTGNAVRLRLTFQVSLDVAGLPGGQGSIQYMVEGGANIVATVRSYFGEIVDTLSIICEVVHTVQG